MPWFNLTQRPPEYNRNGMQKEEMDGESHDFCFTDSGPIGRIADRPPGPEAITTDTPWRHPALPSPLPETMVAVIRSLPVERLCPAKAPDQQTKIRPWVIDGRIMKR